MTFKQNIERMLPALVMWPLMWAVFDWWIGNPAEQWFVKSSYAVGSIVWTCYMLRSPEVKRG